MIIDVITIFSEMFNGPFNLSIIKRAQVKGLVKINIHDLREWADDKRKTVDDRPYGGGAGMVMKVEPIAEAIGELGIKNQESRTKKKVILTSPRGKVWNQEMAREFSKVDHLIIICGHYEGVDERVSEFIDEEISIGDYVLTGGEIPTMVMVDSIVRLIPGVLIKENATINESFSSPTSQPSNPPPLILEYPQYTHPEEYKGLRVPKILLSGNHAEIEKWRKKMAREKTAAVRSDLLMAKSD